MGEVEAAPGFHLEDGGTSRFQHMVLIPSVPVHVCKTGGTLGIPELGLARCHDSGRWGYKEKKPHIFPTLCCLKVGSFNQQNSFGRAKTGVAFGARAIPAQGHTVLVLLPGFCEGPKFWSPVSMQWQS